MSSSEKEHRRKLRVGGIDYLNAQPLLYGLSGDGEPPLTLGSHSPRELAMKLRAGELDVALVPVVAYPEHRDYCVVPGIGISSYGAVSSIRLYCRSPLEKTRTVALDTSSRTSALLTRLLYREVWGGEPSFLEVPPGTLQDVLSSGDPDSASFDAALLIGDVALGCGVYDGWQAVDLGTEWTRRTGLPFVYAFWVCRAGDGPESVPPALVKRLQVARDLGVARVDDIVRDLMERDALPSGFSPGECRRYLSQVIHYDLGEDKLEALELFFTRLHATGLLESPPPPLRFPPLSTS